MHLPYDSTMQNNPHDEPDLHPKYPVVYYDHLGTRYLWFPIVPEQRPAHFRFCDLPPEIRNIIMEFILRMHEPIDVLSIRKPNFNLLRTSKKILYDGLGYWLSNQFKLPIKLDRDQLLATTTTRLHPCKALARHTVKHVLLEIPAVYGKQRFDIALVRDQEALESNAEVYFVMPCDWIQDGPPPHLQGHVFAHELSRLIPKMGTLWHQYALDNVYDILFMERDMRRYFKGLWNDEHHFLATLTLDLQRIQEWMFQRNYVFCYPEPPEIVQVLPFVSVIVAICSVRPMTKKIIFKGFGTPGTELLRNAWEALKSMRPKRPNWDVRALDKSCAIYEAADPFRIGKFEQSCKAKEASYKQEVKEGQAELDEAVSKIAMAISYALDNWHCREAAPLVSRQLHRPLGALGALFYQFNASTHGACKVWHETKMELNELYGKGWCWHGIVNEVLEFYKWEFAE